MTLEEAIKNREKCLRYLEALEQKANPQNVEAVRWSVKALKFMQRSTLTPPNEPLTIEQLREMDGEPVWCKWLLPEDRAIEQGKWFIVISGDRGRPNTGVIFAKLMITARRGSPTAARRREQRTVMSKKTVRFPSFNVSLSDAIEIAKYHLNDPDIAMQSKVMAIEKVAEMETHNSITKNDLVGALRWIYEHYDLLSVL